MKQLLFGTDPEFALKNGENRIVSAIPVLERNKDDKILLNEDGEDGYAIYYDNVLAEGNVPPSNSVAEVKQRLRNLYKRSKTILNNYKLSATASHTFDNQECNHPKAQEFGCDPELDAYAGGPAYPPHGGHSFRSAGGHIHIGNLTSQDVYEKVGLIYLMDIFVGVPSVIMDNDPTSLDRKKLYGKAGRFRDTSYGLEYRVLSNFWLSSPELTELVYDLTMYAAQLFEEGKCEETLRQFDLDEIVDIINTANKGKAQDFINNRLNLPQNLVDRINNIAQLPYSDDIFENWNID